MTIWSIIWETLVVVILTIAIRYVAPLAAKALRSHDYMLAADIVDTAVRAAEQVIRGYKRGEDRYTYAMERIRRALNARGIKISEEEIDQMIEAAVYALDYNWTIEEQEEKGAEE